jgi:hypothetical protein
MLLLALYLKPLFLGGHYPNDLMDQPSLLGFIQSVPELAPQRKQECADNKRDSKLTKINFLLAQTTEL